MVRSPASVSVCFVVDVWENQVHQIVSVRANSSSKKKSSQRSSKTTSRSSSVCVRAAFGVRSCGGGGSAVD